jgi:hypothetical protein
MLPMARGLPKLAVIDVRSDDLLKTSFMILFLYEVKWLVNTPNRTQLKHTLMNSMSLL